MFVSYYPCKHGGKDNYLIGTMLSFNKTVTGVRQAILFVPLTVREVSRHHASADK